METSPKALSAEERSVRASKTLVTLLLTFAAVEFVLIGGGIALFQYTLEQKIAFPWDAAITVFSFISVLGLLTLIFLVIHSVHLTALFWKETAALLGYAYVDRPFFEKEALVFKQGHSKRTGHGLLGHLSDELPFRFFQYWYVTGSGKSSQTHFYSVFEVTFSGSFPHLYFNNTRNKNLEGLQEVFLPEILLPASFAGRAKLYGPKGYEMEALEIFTPDVLAHLLDAGWKHDIELVDHKLYVFCEQTITTKAQLTNELSQIRALMDYLAPKLNRFVLTPIGNLKHTL